MSEMVMDRIRENLASLKMKHTIEILDNYLERAVKDKIMVEAINQNLLSHDPMPQTDDILEKTRHFNSKKCIAEELVIHEMVLVTR